MCLLCAFNLRYGARYWLSKLAAPPSSHTYADGGDYYGQVDAGGVNAHGAGAFTDDEGNRYVGQFAAGEFDGAGTYHFANGRSEVSHYRKGREVGIGAAWSADRTVAWRLVAGIGAAPAPISLEEAGRIADGLGLSTPSSQMHRRRSSAAHPFSQSIL